MLPHLAASLPSCRACAGMDAWAEPSTHVVWTGDRANFTEARRICTELTPDVPGRPAVLAHASDAANVFSLAAWAPTPDALYRVFFELAGGKESAPFTLWIEDGYRSCVALIADYESATLAIDQAANCTQRHPFLCALQPFTTAVPALFPSTNPKLEAKYAPPATPVVLPAVGTAVLAATSSTVGAGAGGSAVDGQEFDDWLLYSASGRPTAFSYATSPDGSLLASLTVTYGEGGGAQVAAHGTHAGGVTPRAVQLLPGEVVVRVQGCQRRRRGVERLMLHTNHGFQYHLGANACTEWFDFNVTGDASAHLAAFAGVVLDGGLAQLRTLWASSPAAAAGVALSERRARLPRGDPSADDAPPVCADAIPFSTTPQCGPSVGSMCPTSICCDSGFNTCSTFLSFTTCKVTCLKGWGACESTGGISGGSAISRVVFVYLEPENLLYAITPDALVPHLAAERTCLQHPLSLNTVPSTPAELLALFNAPRMPRRIYSAIFPSKPSISPSISVPASNSLFGCAVFWCWLGATALLAASVHARILS